MKPGVELWKTEQLAHTFLEGVRGGIPLAGEQIEVMLRVVEARAEPVRRFADLGCGDGILAAALLDRHPRARGTLVDFSPPMLERARARLGARLTQIRLLAADLNEPGWAEGIRQRSPFDAMVSGYTIHHLANTRKRALYGEIFDLLAPGGVFVNIEHVASSTPWLAAVHDDFFIDSLHAFHGRQGAGLTRQQIADRYVHRPDKQANILASVEDQCAWLRAIGFQDVDCYLKVFELAVFGGRKSRTALQRGSGRTGEQR